MTQYDQPNDSDDYDDDEALRHHNASLEMQEFEEIQQLNGQTFSPFLEGKD